jgi:hypothetical protein
MERPDDNPLPPFFEFDPTDASEVFVFDKPGHIYQEPPEFEDGGPDQVFDSRGRLAELGVEDYLVVIKGWSEPKMEQFDKCLRGAAAYRLPDEEVRALGTFELRDRLEVVVRQWQREHSLTGRLSAFTQNLRRFVSRRSE